METSKRQQKHTQTHTNSFSLIWIFVILRKFIQSLMSYSWLWIVYTSNDVLISSFLFWCITIFFCSIRKLTSTTWWFVFSSFLFVHEKCCFVRQYILWFCMWTYFFPISLKYLYNRHKTNSFFFVFKCKNRLFCVFRSCYGW